jgi:hypothetical protein
MTGYFYGSLFFTPIDVPFLAAMTWATLGIVVMTRRSLPSWPATAAVGLLTGLAIATRTGGIITHAYLFGAMVLCVAETWARHGRLTLRYLCQIAVPYAAVITIAWAVAIALWPWLQIGNPWSQFKVALLHFASIPMSYEFSHWGKRIWTDALPRSYIPSQLLARLPEAFLVLLAIALVPAIHAVAVLSRETTAIWRVDRNASLRAAVLMVARERACLVVCAAVIAPLAFLVIQRATIYNGIRHVLFVIPMLAVIAGAGFRALLPLLRRAPVITAIAGGTYAGGIITTLAVLHPLEYVAMNSLAGGTRGAYDKFELDYWSVAAAEALRRLEHRLDYNNSLRTAETIPNILICIPWREERVAPMLQRRWIVQTDPTKADFIIATELSRCADNEPVELIDEVKRFDRTFAWTYARRSKRANPESHSLTNDERGR